MFSGGMKRRLEIARGLLHTPKILFLDEPTLGLDPQTRNQLWTHVKHLNQTEGVTVFLTTHYMDEADRVAQRIAIIDHGKIVAQGTPQELKQQTGKDSLEEAFLALTGSTIRDEAATVRRSDAPDGTRCGGIADERDLHPVAARAEALRPFARADRGLARPAAALPAGLGFGLGPVFQKAGQGNYVQFVAPGIIAMTILFSSVFSGIGLLWDRQFGFLKETLVAPVPRIQIMLGPDAGRRHRRRDSRHCWWRSCASSRASVPYDLRALPLALLFMVLIACLFAALGTAIGSVLQNMQGFQLIMNFLVMPIFFLSGALYPLDQSAHGSQHRHQPRPAWPTASTACAPR